ncbi:TerB family tellurite resistance protein [Niveispirillum fermenti]|uniref:TerB family tellurite resistance protein n=1 Tax=Niveispirillum fermenti TaxID=1233113 RepID=UPI003A85E665
MSIWGKVIGGAAGFALGGPLGALLGALAGHAVDEYRAAEQVPRGVDANGRPDQTQTIAFTVGVIVLSAKMAKADGVVQRAEIDAFKRIFQVPEGEMRNVGRLFDAAKRDSAGFEPYARQLAQMFQDRPAVLEELLAGLFHIAAADGVVHQAELVFLRRVADIFGFPAAEFEQVWRQHGAHLEGADEPDADPHAVLGVARDADFATVKAAYRKLVRENHPDRLIAQGLPQEFIDLAQEKMSALNAAYEKIERAHRERG